MPPQPSKSPPLLVVRVINMAEKRKAEDELAPAGADAKPKLTEASSSSAQAAVAPAVVGAAVAGGAGAGAGAGAVPDWLKKDSGTSTVAPGATDAASKKAAAAAERKRKAAQARINRGNYRCSKCGEPKKGHVCAYQPMRSRAASGPRPTLNSKEVQVEMDDDMTVRALRAVPAPQPVAVPAPLPPPPAHAPAAAQPPLLG